MFISTIQKHVACVAHEFIIWRRAVPSDPTPVQFSTVYVLGGNMAKCGKVINITLEYGADLSLPMTVTGLGLTQYTQAKLPKLRW